MGRGALLERLAPLLPPGDADPVPKDFVAGRDSLLRILLDRGLLDPDALQKFLARETGVPRAGAAAGTPAHLPELPESWLRERELLSLDGEGRRWACVWPHEVSTLDDLRFRGGVDIECAVISRRDYRAAQCAAAEEAGDDRTLLDTLIQEAEAGAQEIEVIPSYDLLEDPGMGADDAPVIKLLNQVIAQAYRSKASDIHLEAEEKVTRIRFRIDGQLREVMRTPKKMHNSIVSRIKIMSELDIAEKRLPQDGRIKIRLGDDRVDLRVSTIPSVLGEKVVMRILNPHALLDLSQLGFTSAQEERFRGIVSRPFGIVLVTGPTGSGKTTTLYSALKFLNTKAKNIVTIEDPVEYQMENINQIQVNRRAGIDFASGLKSILRQDPNIIMVGEMRDEETASIAVKAALTGHLVLSTLHTNDAPGSYARLCDMKIAPYLLASSISGVIAQRLVRVICSRCKVPDQPTTAELLWIGLDPATRPICYKGSGCRECDGSGFRGRTGIYEILTPTSEVKKMILAGTLAEGCTIPGFARMVDHGRAKVLEGVITVGELCQTVRQPELA